MATKAALEIEVGMDDGRIMVVVQETATRLPSETASG